MGVQKQGETGQGDWSSSSRPKVWPPVVKGWKRGDGSWRWDDHRSKPYGLAFNIRGSKHTVWGSDVNECIVKRTNTQAAAKAAEAEREAGIKRGVTVIELMEQWYKYRKGGKQAPTTQESWARSVEFVRASELANKPANSVIKGDVKKYLTWLAEERNQGASSVRHRRQHLAAAFKSGIDDGYVDRNPAVGVDTPGSVREPVESVPLMPDEFVAMRAFLSSNPTLSNVALLLMLLTGARGGEVLGLAWKNVDLDEGTFEVCQAVQRSNGGRVRTVTPKLKTKASQRTLELTPDAVRLLRSMRQERPFGLVFSKDGTEPIRAEALYYACEKACDAIGVERRSPHKLRHSNATYLSALGELPADLARHLGHGDMSTLPVYVKATKRRVNTAALLGDGTAG